MIFQINRKCKELEDRTKNNSRDDEAFADWGSMLMHLSLVSEDQDAKKRHLDQSIEKLQKAIDIREDSVTSENELALFSLGNAYYFKIFLEKDDDLAQQHLLSAKEKFEAAHMKDPTNTVYASMIDQVRLFVVSVR